MPFTNGETVSYGAGTMPVYWCKYGCTRGHTDPVRIMEHEETELEGPQMKVIEHSQAGHYRYECTLCDFRGAQPFDIAVHRCPFSAFECSKRPIEPRKEPKKKRQMSTASTSSTASTTSI